MVLENIAEAISDDTRNEFDGHVDATAIERSYIGASNIGHPCEHSIAFRLRGFPSDTLRPSLRRIFNDGHNIERIVGKHILNSLELFEGWKLEDYGELESQKTYTYFGNVCRAHSDGVLVNGKDKYLVEIKSANDNSYNEIKRLGIKTSKKIYYDQAQFMMGLGGMKQCLFVIYNKNNSRIHTEIVDYDDVIFHYLCARAEYIASGQSERCSDTPSDYRCYMCQYTEVCWNDGHIWDDERTCRHCAYSVMDSDEDTFAICRHPKKMGERVPFDSSHEVKCFTATTCPFFKDYRLKGK